MLSLVFILYGMVAPAWVSTFLLFPQLTWTERLLWTVLLSIILLPLVIYVLNTVISLPINRTTILSTATLINLGAGGWLLWQTKHTRQV